MLKNSQRSDGFAQESLRTRSHRFALKRVIPGSGEHNAFFDLRFCEFLNQIGTVTIRQTHVHDNDGRAINLQVTPRRADAISPSDTRTRAQAQQSHRFASVAAVFYHQYCEAQQRTRSGRRRIVCGKWVIGIHRALRFHKSFPILTQASLRES